MTAAGGTSAVVPTTGPDANREPTLATSVTLTPKQLETHNCLMKQRATSTPEATRAKTETRGDLVEGLAAVSATGGNPSDVMTIECEARAAMNELHAQASIEIKHRDLLINEQQVAAAQGQEVSGQRIAVIESETAKVVTYLQAQISATQTESTQYVEQQALWCAICSSRSFTARLLGKSISTSHNART